jgi:hypothetical protein
VNEPAPPTLGARLDAAGRALARRHRVAVGWLAAARPVLERAAALDEPHDGRFARREQVPPGLAVPGRRPAGAGPDEPLPVIRRDAATPAAGAGGHPRPATTPAGVVAGSRAAAPAPPATAAPVPAGRPLPPDVRARLRPLVGPAADVLRVHEGPAADALARQHTADAVTVGHDVHVRSGRLRPDEPAGFALLAHEAVHVAAAVSGASHARTRPGGVGAEEDAALAVEATAHRMATGGPPPAAAAPAPAPAPAAPAGGPAPAAARPMTAHVDRAVPTAAALDVEQLRRELVRDVMRRLRSDFERGA